MRQICDEFDILNIEFIVVRYKYVYKQKKTLILALSILIELKKIRDKSVSKKRNSPIYWINPFTKLNLLY